MPIPNPNVLVLRAPGTNCDAETAHAFELAGAATERIHVQQLLESPKLLERFQVLCLPGGFSFGDDIASGRILGNQLRLRLAESLLAFREEGKLVLGICNGFQVLMKTGLLDVDDDQGPQATLAWNDSGKYEARWVTLDVQPASCVFLAGIERLDVPVAHAEGKFAVRDQAALEQFDREGRLVLRYAGLDDSPIAYPANPNGSAGNVAGICDRTGRVLGLMPHPERFVRGEQHPTWTRNSTETAGAGLRLFENAVAYFR